MENTIRAGRIDGNPLNGLCERVCIQTKKVFDGCIVRFSNIRLEIPLTNFSVMGAPYNFIRLRSTDEVSVSNLVVSPLTDGKNRISLTINTLVSVYYETANGVSGWASGNVVTERDVVLSAPSESLVPYSVEVTSFVRSSVGSFNADQASVTVSACIVQIIRVVAPVEILVPTYGYCRYPECESYATRQCQAVFSLPVFPINE